jgi:hypothetical protein
VLAAGLISGCSTSSSPGNVPIRSTTLEQPSVRVLVASPQLSDAQFTALIPPNHLRGEIEGQFLTCGPVGHVLKPYQMARHPVTVSLIYKGRVVASVHLVLQSRFFFVVIGPRAPKRTIIPGSLEQPALWNASFVLTTSAGGRDGVSLGGIAGAGGVLLSYPNQPPAHPCGKGSPNY